MTLQRILGTTHGGYSNDIQLHSNRWSSCRCRWSGLRMTQSLSQTRPRHPWPWFVVGMWQGYWRPKLLDESNVAARLRLNQVATWSFIVFSCRVHFLHLQRQQWSLKSISHACRTNLTCELMYWLTCLACHFFWGISLCQRTEKSKLVMVSEENGILFPIFNISFPFPFSRPALMHWVSS